MYVHCTHMYVLLVLLYAVKLLWQCVLLKLFCIIGYFVSLTFPGKLLFFYVLHSLCILVLPLFLTYDRQ